MLGGTSQCKHAFVPHFNAQDRDELTVLQGQRRTEVVSHSGQLLAVHSLPFGIRGLWVFHHRFDPVGQDDHGLHRPEVKQEQGRVNGLGAVSEVVPVLPLVLRKVHEIPEQERLHRSGYLWV